MRDFDKEWERMERSHARMERFVGVWFAFVLLLMLVMLGVIVYVFAHPELIGQFAGKIVDGFRDVPR